MHGGGPPSRKTALRLRIRCQCRVSYVSLECRYLMTIRNSRDNWHDMHARNSPLESPKPVVCRSKALMDIAKRQNRCRIQGDAPHMRSSHYKIEELAERDRLRHCCMTTIHANRGKPCYALLCF